MTDEVGLDELPVAVRTRVLALVAEVLPDVASLPPTLRRVAAFAPARRARLGGTAITEALADAELRGRVAHQVSVRRQDELQALRAGTLNDPLEGAALAWIVRPQGWTHRVEGAVSAEQDRAEAAEREREERWRDRAEQAEQQIREIRALHRQQVEEYKAEITTLRRSLGEARSTGREDVSSAERAVHAAEEARASAEVALAAQEKEVRRLRGVVERLELDLQAERRAERGSRDVASVRTRVLLDTILEATAGLRRELALPPVTGSPADRVEADLMADSAPPGGPTVEISPAMLEQYLAVPRARLLVDGYNVSMSTWPTSSLEAQRTRLLSALGPVVARTGAETTVVFDAADADTRPPLAAPRGVKALFSPRGVIADDVIADLVAAEPPGRMVVVVSDDQEVRTRVRAAGARPVAAAALVALTTR